MDEQIKGGHHDSSEDKILDSRQEHEIFFEKLKSVYYDINSWTHLFKNVTSFQVTDINGIDKFGKIEVGDLVKIKIPGPKPKTGDGFDWVKIKHIKFTENTEFKSICLALSPTRKPDGNTTAHFYTSESTNYHIIKDYGNRIVAEVHGRNEVPNLKNLPFRDKIRNYFTAKGGLFGLSKLQWEIWTKNILNDDILDECLCKRRFND